MIITDIYSAVLIRCVSVIRAVGNPVTGDAESILSINTTNELMLNVTIVYIK